MFTTSSKFGIEIELTGITRKEAANILAKVLQGETLCYHGSYAVTDSQGRTWAVVPDGSIERQRKSVRTNTRNSSGSRSVVSVDPAYSVELVSPVLSYQKDIETLQSVVRAIRKAGGFTNSSCGIHIHLDGALHNARSICNFINLVASRNDLFYKAFQINPERQRFCKKMDNELVSRLNAKKPKTLTEIERIWYENYSARSNIHYHPSRYHFLNLHSFFHGHHTVELRDFNSTLHAGKVRAYIVFALAINYQALSQKSASYRKVQSENEKFAMRVYLNRVGLKGETYKNCRKHLYEHLDGNAAWRYGSRENCRNHRRSE